MVIRNQATATSRPSHPDLARQLSPAALADTTMDQPHRRRAQYRTPDNTETDSAWTTAVPARRDTGQHRTTRKAETLQALRLLGRAERAAASYREALAIQARLGDDRGQGMASMLAWVSDQVEALVREMETVVVEAAFRRESPHPRWLTCPAAGRGGRVPDQPVDSLDSTSVDVFWRPGGAGPAAGDGIAEGRRAPR